MSYSIKKAPGTAVEVAAGDTTVDAGGEVGG